MPAPGEANLAVDLADLADAINQPSDADTAGIVPVTDPATGEVISEIETTTDPGSGFTVFTNPDTGASVMMDPESGSMAYFDGTTGDTITIAGDGATTTTVDATTGLTTMTVDDPLTGETETIVEAPSEVGELLESAVGSAELTDQVTTDDLLDLDDAASQVIETLPSLDTLIDETTTVEVPPEGVVPVVASETLPLVETPPLGVVPI